MEHHEDFFTLSRHKDPNPRWKGPLYAVFFFGLGFLTCWMLH